jgi:hypothetical protein
VFALDPPDTREFDKQVDAGAQEILMEGFRLQDEFNALRSRLPPMDHPLRLRLPCEPRLSELSATELDLLQDVLNAPTLGAVFDTVHGTDLDAARSIATLVQRGYLETAG